MAHAAVHHSAGHAINQNSTNAGTGTAPLCQQIAHLETRDGGGTEGAISDTKDAFGGTKDVTFIKCGKTDAGAETAAAAGGDDKGSEGLVQPRGQAGANF